MDYFYASAYNKGLWDKILSVDFKPTKKLSFSLNYHHFSTTYDVMATDGKEGRCLGSELDMQVDYILIFVCKLYFYHDACLLSKDSIFSRTNLTT